VTDYDLFGVEIELRAESAANLRGYDAKLVFRDADEAWEERADEVRNLS
jgi:hypothetical protein